MSPAHAVLLQLDDSSVGVVLDVIVFSIILFIASYAVFLVAVYNKMSSFSDFVGVVLSFSPATLSAFFVDLGGGGPCSESQFRTELGARVQRRGGSPAFSFLSLFTQFSPFVTFLDPT